MHSAELVIVILILEACALRDLILSQEVLTKLGGMLSGFGKFYGHCDGWTTHIRSRGYDHRCWCGCCN